MRSNIAFNNKIAEITDEFGLSTQAEKFGLPIRANFGNDTKRYLEELSQSYLRSQKERHLVGSLICCGGFVIQFGDLSPNICSTH